MGELFTPRSVAIVGLSPVDEHSFARRLALVLKEAKFPNIYPVNPKYTEALGLPCFPNLRSIPGPVDHVVVSIPAKSVLALLDDCAAKGVKSVHFFTAGFSESGDAKRAELEKAMLDKAKEGGFRIIGPNCVGLLVPGSRFITTTATPLEPGPIGFLSQSGGHAENLPVLGSPRGLRFSKIISYGNALDVDESELLEYFSQDPETRIIAAYVEGVKIGSRFLRALRDATARKPVVFYKGGITEAGRRATYGHTASLTSSAAVFAALCRQLGVIQVDDMEELVDMLVALCFANPPPGGYGVGVIGAGGGPSVLAADEMEKAGLRLPALSPEAQRELRHFLPLAGSIFSNPVDAAALLSPEAVSATMCVLGKIPDIHILLYHQGFHPLSWWGDGRFSSPAFLQAAVKALTQAQRATGKTVLLALRPPLDVAGMKDFLAAQNAFASAGFPVFHSLRQAARTVARMVAWSRSRP